VAEGASRHDFAVIGAGILGLATARELLRRHPAARIVVLEKEDRPAQHQSGHNSGVVHSGLYYAPGSAKARLCVEGRRLLLAFCAERSIPVDQCGKLVIATEESELTRFAELQRRGEVNGLKGLQVLDEHEIASIEPEARGIRALWVPEAGIVDYTRVAAALEAELRELGAMVRYGTAVNGVRVVANTVEVTTGQGTIIAERAIACAGLYSDRIARMMGAASNPQIVPFRGDYYVLPRERRSLVRGLIYPVPDPRFPFLGIHFTRRIGGDIWLGPNAVLAFAREGYRRRDVDLGELAETVRYEGFRRLAAQHWRTGLGEIVRDHWKPLFLAALQRYVPAVTLKDLLPGPSGVRAQAVDANGKLVDDFVYDQVGPMLSVRNAPSPAATSSLALAQEFADRLGGVSSAPVGSPS
jgi:L-2-hydroxyglutarate oxidase LhgO